MYTVLFYTTCVLQALRAIIGFLFTETTLLFVFPLLCVGSVLLLIHTNRCNLPIHKPQASVCVHIVVCMTNFAHLSTHWIQHVNQTRLAKVIHTYV